MRTIVVSDIFEVIHDMKLTVLALDGVFDTGFSAVLDVFITANDLAALQQPGVGPHFEIDVIGMRRDVRTALGMRVQIPSSSAGQEAGSLRAFRLMQPRAVWQSVREHCSAASRLCLENLRFLTSRTFASSEPFISCARAASASRQLPRRSVMPTARPCARCCAGALGAGCASYVAPGQTTFESLLIGRYVTFSWQG